MLALSRASVQGPASPGGAAQSRNAVSKGEGRAAGMFAAARPPPIALAEPERCSGPAADGKQHRRDDQKREEETAFHREHAPWSRSASAARVPKMRMRA